MELRVLRYLKQERAYKDFNNRGTSLMNQSLPVRLSSNPTIAIIGKISLVWKRCRRKRLVWNSQKLCLLRNRESLSELRKSMGWEHLRGANAQVAIKKPQQGQSTNAQATNGAPVSLYASLGCILCAVCHSALRSAIMWNTFAQTATTQ